MDKHNKAYTIILMVMAFGWLLSITIMATMLDGSTSIRLVQCINGCLLLAVITTLVLRFTRPQIGKQVTKALNIVLLLAFPIGTAVAIYGLLKVDKGNDEAGPNKASQPIAGRPGSG